MRYRTAALAALAALAIAGCGGGPAAPRTHVERCAAAFQAYVDAGLRGQSAAKIAEFGTPAEQAITRRAHTACAGLTRAQAKAAARLVH